MNGAETAFWGNALAPFLLLAILAAVGIPVTLAIRRWMKDGPTKRAILDRQLTKRHPWVQWLAAILAFLAIPVGGWLGITINSWLR